MLVKEKIIRIISVLFITGSVLFFGGRAVLFFLENEGIYLFPKKEQEYTLVEKVLADGIELPGKDGLVKIDDKYVFYGNVKNNYLNFSGQSWRIISIDEKQNITLVSDKPLVALNLVGDYLESELLHLLNDESEGLFLRHLKNRQYLQENIACYDTIDEKIFSSGEKFSCKYYANSTKVNVLDVTQYLTVGGNKSYINNGFNFWLANKASAEDYWFVSFDGKLIHQGSSDMILGVKVTITIATADKLLRGNGSQGNPYVFEDKVISTIDEAMVGDYVRFSDSLWKIYAITDEGVKLVSNGYIDTKRQRYSSTTSAFDLKDKNSVAYLLNNEYLQSLSDNEMVVESLWNIGEYNNVNKYFDFSKTKTKTVKAKVGMLAIGDLYLLDWNGAFTITPNFNIPKLYTIFAVNDSYLFYAANPVSTDRESLYKIRPAVCIDGNIIVSSGLGLESNPYVIGEKYEEP